VPPLLLPSPTILDQTFPRSRDELDLVAISLGELLNLLDNDQCGILLTNSLREFTEFFDWDRTGPYPLISEIHRFLSLLTLQPHEHSFVFDTSNLSNTSHHPIPGSCTSAGLIQEWSIEAGKILHAHTTQGDPRAPCIGIACALAFAGRNKDCYTAPAAALPLVGPDEISKLHDIYDWKTPSDIHQKDVSFAEAKKNIFAIGATAVTPPKGSSHYIVKFKNNRNWPLDRNTDPIPLRFLGQLKQITGYPLDVIKTALIDGELPTKTIRIAGITQQ